MKAIRLIFFGNIFYGICGVALAIEGSLQQRYPVPPLEFYLAIFSITILYYQFAYISDQEADANNKRSVWYASNKMLVKRTQWILLAVLIVAILLLPWKTIRLPKGILEWALALVFPLAGLLYYGLSGAGIGRFTLRRIGWLKPFAIGFTWAGLVTVYPVLYHHLRSSDIYVPTVVSLFLFIKNFMFITVLCILFDIKDYAVDHNTQIKTFVVQHGLRKTLFFIILPLCVAGLGSFVTYAIINHFHPVKILLNMVPFFALIAVTYAMQMRRSIFYYLVIIDGLMLLKAFCGITAMTYF